MYIEHSNSSKAIFHSGKKLEWLNVASKHQTSVIFIFLLYWRLKSRLNQKQKINFWKAAVGALQLSKVFSVETVKSFPGVCQEVQAYIG